MDIREYQDFNLEEILHLYASVGWTNYTDRADMLEKAFSNSLFVLGAYDGKTLIGIIRVVGDDASIIFIQDLLVLPEYQGRGIGTRLIKAILERYAHVYQLQLMTDGTEKNIAFYKSCGLINMADFNCCTFMRP